MKWIPLFTVPLLAVLAGGCADTTQTSPPRVVARPYGAVELAGVTLYTPEPIFAQRVPDTSVFSDYLKKIVADADVYCAKLPHREPQTAELVVALKPNGRSRFWCEFSTDAVSPERVRELELRLARLPTPSVREGPVAALLHLNAWGGTNQTRLNQAAGSMYFPKQWKEAASKVPRQTVTVPDDILDLVWPE